MPITIIINPKQQLVIAKCIGDLYESDFQSAFQCIKNSSDYELSFNEIWDLRDSGKLQFSFEDWEGLEGDAVKTKTREAIIVSTDTQHKMAKEYAILGIGAGLDVRIFYDYDEAMDWATTSS